MISFLLWAIWSSAKVCLICTTLYLLYYRVYYYIISRWYYERQPGVVVASNTWPMLGSMLPLAKFMQQ
jgi:hypothetical protein